jgi:arylsulfatase A-like enzyme
LRQLSSFFKVTLSVLTTVVASCAQPGPPDQITDFGVSSADATRPNILFIMSDDHAISAIGAYGSELIETPNIDRIANEGILFANSFVTNSICAPSRAVMLTGKYSHVNGLRDNRDTFDGSQQTFPKLFQQAGYQTAMVGKWHLKSEPTGFDDWRILRGQGQYYNPLLLANGVETEVTGYVTDLITEQSLDFLENRDRSRPFALLYQHKAPHRNWMPATRHLGAFGDRELPFPETFRDDYEGRPAAAAQDMRIADLWLTMDLKIHPEYFEVDDASGGKEGWDPVESWRTSYERLTDEQREAWDAYYRPINEAFRDDPPTGEALDEWKLQRYLEDYLGTVVALDENIGRVLDYLDENGLAENTIVVYTSDQGFYLGEHGWYDKRFMYEESLRTPLLLRFPARLEADQRVEELALNVDFAPTLLDLAGLRIPDDMQGRALQPLVGGSSGVEWRDAIYYRYYEFPHGWHLVRPHYGVRTDRYKLIHFEADMDHWELFDLESDPHELRNIYDVEEYTEVQKYLHRRLVELRQELGDEG